MVAEEIKPIDTSTHAPDCGCAVCEGWRKAMDEQQGGPVS